MATAVEVSGVCVIFAVVYMVVALGELLTMKENISYGKVRVKNGGCFPLI